MKEHDLEALSSYVDDELDPAERRRVEAHVEACGACREELERFLAVRGAIASVGAPPSDAERRRALRAVLADRETPYWRRSVRIPVPAAAALAAALVVAGAALVSVRPGDRRDEPPRPAARADLSRYDAGGRLEVRVERRSPNGS